MAARPRLALSTGAYATPAPAACPQDQESMASTIFSSPSFTALTTAS